MRTAAVRVSILMSFFLMSELVAGQDAPASQETYDFLRDRGPGIPTSLFGTYVQKGELSINPFFMPRRTTFQNTPLAAKKATPNLARQVGADFKNVFTTKENMLIVGAGLSATWAVSHFDRDLASSSLNSELNEGARLDHFFEAGETLGGGLVQVGGAFAAYGLGKVFAKQGLEDTGRDLVRAQLVTQTLTFGVKLAVRRERPDGSNNRSFPSGHASGTFATATVLQRRYGWKVGVPAYAVAGYVAVSRMNEGEHYLSDVLFGATIGVLVGRTVTVSLARKRFAVVPMPARDGVGVQLTWLGSERDAIEMKH